MVPGSQSAPMSRTAAGEKRDIVRAHLDALCRSDLAAFAATMADNMVRIGSSVDRAHDYHSKDRYMDYVRACWAGLATYRNEVHDVLYSADGRRAYAQVTEWITFDDSKDDFIVEFCGAFEIDANGLICRHSLYYKSTNHFVKRDRHMGGEATA